MSIEKLIELKQSIPVFEKYKYIVPRVFKVSHDTRFNRWSSSRYKKKHTE